VIRIWLSFSVSGLVLIVGTYAACVQSDNFARAAKLHELQLKSDWHLRRATQLRVQLERYRFEFSAPGREDAPSPAGALESGFGSLGAGREGSL
jgi:hypothetical protein